MTRDVYKSIVGKTYRHKVQVEFTSNDPRQWLFAATGGGLHTLTQLDEATDGYGNPRNVVVTYLEEPKEIKPRPIPKEDEVWNRGINGLPYLVLAVNVDKDFVVVQRQIHAGKYDPEAFPLFWFIENFFKRT